MSPVHVLIPAAGRGVRFDSPKNKILATLAGAPIVARAVQAFLPVAETITVLCADNDHEELERALAFAGDTLRILQGGQTRQRSVRNGLASLSGAPPNSVVAVHDAARPLVSRDVIERCISSARQLGSGVAAVPIYETMKRATEGGQVIETVDRDAAWAVQTPQAFRLSLLREASDAAEADGFAGTDEASLVQRLGQASVQLVMGARENIKITTPNDLQFAQRWIAGSTPEMRVGHGYDVHRLAGGRPLWLGGVQIDFDQGLAGHSDADVVLHALCDALLGAAGMPDIGRIYPDTDDRFKGASSIDFVRDVAKRLMREGWRVANIDCTLIAERPKIAAYSDRMRQTIAAALDVADSRINLKATTHEGLGALGAGLGIACHATCLIWKPGAM